jgi:hypothetical protein
MKTLRSSLLIALIFSLPALYVAYVYYKNYTNILEIIGFYNIVIIIPLMVLLAKNFIHEKVINFSCFVLVLLFCFILFTTIWCNILQKQYKPPLIIYTIFFWINIPIYFIIGILYLLKLPPDIQFVINCFIEVLYYNMVIIFLINMKINNFKKIKDKEIMILLTYLQSSGYVNIFYYLFMEKLGK